MSNVITPLVTTFDQYDAKGKAAFLDMVSQVRIDVLRWCQKSSIYAESAFKNLHALKHFTPYFRPREPRAMSLPRSRSSMTSSTRHWLSKSTTPTRLRRPLSSLLCVAFLGL